MNDDFLLSDAQLEAASASEGYVRVIAGAGSGKTRTLSSRFAFLTGEIGILPSNILCITFTNKAAAEMRRRIRSLVGDEDTGMICTFHGLCNSILLEESHAISYPKSFMVLDSSDVDDLLRLVYEEKGLTLRDMTFARARDMIEMKKTREYPGYTHDLIHLDAKDLYRRFEQAKDVEDMIFFGYLYHQKKSFALDYDDLILLTLKIFREHRDLRDKWTEQFEYIMVDEFQDIDPLQYELLELLARGHGNLFVVGDPDQTIYTWRGANVRFLLDFDSVFTPCRTITLNENFRSTPQILRCANELIAHNKTRIDKKLTAMNFDGAAVHAGHFQDAHAEAQGAVQAIEHLCSKGYALRDIAILYRAHYLSRPFEDELAAAQIPYSIYSGLPFFARMEIKDAISWARMLLYRDDLDFMRTINKPKRNIGKSRMAFLKQFAQERSISLYDALCLNVETERFASTKAADYLSLIENFDLAGKSITRILDEILKASGYEAMLRTEGGQDRLDNLAELKQAAAEYEISWGEDTTLDGWLRHLSLMSAADQQPEADRIRLMTVHSAKGLEFPCVLLVGMNEGIFPSRQTRTLAAMEEERRLAFVAMTRAKNELYLSEAAGQMHSGSSRYPSRFLFDVQNAEVQWNPPIPDDIAAAGQRMISLKSLRTDPAADQILETGDRVEHAIFGMGTVTECDPDGGKIVVQFDHLNTRRTLSLKAKLKKTGNVLPASVLH